VSLTPAIAVILEPPFGLYLINLGPWRGTWVNTTRELQAKSWGPDIRGEHPVFWQRHPLYSLICLSLLCCHSSLFSSPLCEGSSLHPMSDALYLLPFAKGTGCSIRVHLACLQKATYIS
jgi:hypothetical protein